MDVATSSRGSQMSDSGVRELFLAQCCKHEDGSDDGQDSDLAHEKTDSRASVRDFRNFHDSRGHGFYSRGSVHDEHESETMEDSELQDHITLLNGEAQKIEEALVNRKRHLEIITKAYEHRRAEVEKEIENFEQEAQSLRESVYKLENPVELGGEPEEVPPGPAYLRWVEGQTFSFFSCLIVCTNLVFMVFEKLLDDNTDYKKHKSQVFWVDQGFLIFYIVELSLKAVLWGSKLLLGRPCSAVWANWLDLIIIVTAVIDQWILPLFKGSGGSGVSFGILRVFRLARLFRMIKVCGLWLRADLSWAEGEGFTNFILGVIVVNCLLMGVQVSYESLAIWDYLENLVLVIFLFELAVRLRFLGCSFFYNANCCMNWLDFIIVLGGMIYLWLIPSISFVCTMFGGQALDPGSLQQLMTMLRLMRLVRLLRLVRLVRSITPLYQLLLGIIEAMSGMVWVLSLTVAILYLISLLCCQLIGPGGVMLEAGDLPADVKAVFHNVPVGMWALFMAMNGDAEYLQPVLDEYPISMLLTAVYMVFTGFAILSVLTGVVCDRMADAAEKDTKEREVLEEKTKTEEAKAKMDYLFNKLNVDGNGYVSMKEYFHVMEDDWLAEELCEAAEMDRSELPHIWEALSKSQKSAPGLGLPESAIGISKKDWMEGILSARHGATELSIRRLEKELGEIRRVVEGKPGNGTPSMFPSHGVLSPRGGMVSSRLNLQGSSTPPFRSPR